MSGKDANSRSTERSNVFLSAALYTPTRSFPVRIRNLSPGGALLDGVNLPGEGTYVSLRRAHLSVDGKIAWHANDLRGVRFSAAIDLEEWMKPRAHAAQRRVDHVVAAMRSGERQVGSTGEPGAGRAPETIESISTALERICDRLSNSPSLTDEIAEDLVRLDSLIHALRQLASPKTSGS